MCKLKNINSVNNLTVFSKGVQLLANDSVVIIHNYLRITLKNKNVACGNINSNSDFHQLMKT